MKKVKKFIFICVFSALLILITSCNGSINPSDNSSTATKDSIVVSNFEHGVVTNDSDELSDETKIPGDKLNAGLVYYLIMRVKYYCTCDTDGMQIIQANLKLYNINVVEGKLDSANSSESKTISFTNSTDENDCTQTTIDFKIPEHKDEETDMEIKIKLTPRFPYNTEGNTADCRVALNVSSVYKITGKMNNGTTFTLHVSKTKIEAPKIVWNQRRYTLEWVHVEYASKYEIYLDDVMEPVTTYVVPSQYSVGDTIIYDQIPSLVNTTEEVRIRIRAVANLDNSGNTPAENYESTFCEEAIYITI